MSDLLFGNVGLEVIKFLQSLSNPLLDLFFVVLTNLGSELFYIAIVVIIFVALDKKLGVRLAFYLLLTGLIVGVIKGLVSWIRPYRAHPSVVRDIAHARGFSFPSGHSQSSGAFWTGMYLHVKDVKESWKGLAFLAAIVMIFSVGLSRIYLGVHYPSDVIIGWVIGISGTYLLYVYEEKVIGVITNRFSLRAQIALVSVISLLIFVMYLFVMTILGNDYVIGDISNYIGLIIGVAVGYMLEEKYIAYQPPSLLKKRMAATVVAMLLALASYVAFSLLIPEVSNQLLQVILRGLKYLFIGFVLILGIPLLLRQLSLEGRKGE